MEEILEQILTVLERAKGGGTVESIVEAIDFSFEVRYDPEEIYEALLYLEQEGYAVAQDDKWFRA